MTNDRDLTSRDTHHCYEQRWDRENTEYFGWKTNGVRLDIEILNKDLEYNRVKHGLFRPCLHGRKSDLKIDHLIGKNLNAVLIQIFVTMIAYLLIALFRIFHNS